MSKSVAIIGAGISGANLAKKLNDAGVSVKIFEKARGPGGRTSSRKFSYQGEDYKIDHGAQFIDVVSEEFQDFVNKLEKNSIVEEIYQEEKFKGFEGRTFVAVPAMNAITKYLTKDLEVNYSIGVGRVVKEGKKLALLAKDGSNLGVYDSVLSTTPPKQTAEIFQDFEVFEPLAGLEMKLHFAIMLASEKKYDFGFKESNLDDSLLNWIGINSEKPQRAKEPLSIIMHTNFLWSLKNKDLDESLIIKLALDELEQITGFKDEAPIYQACHRWLYGRTLEPLGVDFIFERKNNIGCCGDYMLGDNIEAAYISSTRLAERIISTL